MSKRSENLISDHALLRWLERVRGLDVVELRREIAASTPGLNVFVGALRGRAGRVPLGNGLTAIIRDGVVVSFVPSGGKQRLLRTSGDGRRGRDT